MAISSQLGWPPGIVNAAGTGYGAETFRAGKTRRMTMADAATIRRLETRFWQSMVDKDPQAAMTMIADACLVTGPQGAMRIDPQKFADMTGHGQWRLDSFEFDGLDVVFPSEDVAVVAYTVREKGEMKGKPMDMRCADSSTWVQQHGEWKCALHTETILEVSG
jgi:ketosteroid isomerase-like protein